MDLSKFWYDKTQVWQDSSGNNFQQMDFHELCAALFSWNVETRVSCYPPKFKTRPSCFPSNCFFGIDPDIWGIPKNLCLGINFLWYIPDILFLSPISITYFYHLFLSLGKQPIGIPKCLETFGSCLFLSPRQAQAAEKEEASAAEKAAQVREMDSRLVVSIILPINFTTFRGILDRKMDGWIDR